MSAYRTLEHHEHAEHMAHGGHHEAAHEAKADEHAHTTQMQWSALLVAVLAAVLAISEQGAKHAEIRVQQQAIDTADAWAQYQAKSTRGTIAKDLAEIVAVLDVGSDPAAIARRDKLVEQFKKDQDGFERDPKDGKEAISHRAKHIEHEREHSMEQTHAYHNGSAAAELGIVLATASAITRSKMLIYMAIAFGIGGAICAVLGYFAPEYGAF